MIEIFKNIVLNIAHHSWESNTDCTMCILHILFYFVVRNASVYQALTMALEGSFIPSSGDRSTGIQNTVIYCTVLY